MDNQKIFERVESKYIINTDTYKVLMMTMSSHIRPDVFPVSSITSLYFDSDDYRLIRNSLEHPAYKEKLRLRCYGIPQKDTQVFYELKKKRGSTTYKRRQDMTYDKALSYLKEGKLPCETQIMKEIDYCRTHNSLSPRVLIHYDRESWVGVAEDDLRITFDRDIRFSLDDFSLDGHPAEQRITGENTVIMEIKTLQCMPLWLTHILDELKIYPDSMSKYGRIYQEYIMKGERTCLNHYSTQYTPTLSALTPTYSAH